MQSVDTQKVLANLKKARGMIDKLSSMVESDEYCVDIASQINATIGLLKSANLTLLESHLACCGPKFLTTKDGATKDAFIKELVRARNVSSK